MGEKSRVWFVLKTQASMVIIAIVLLGMFIAIPVVFVLTKQPDQAKLIFIHNQTEAVIEARAYSDPHYNSDVSMGANAIVGYENIPAQGNVAMKLENNPDRFSFTVIQGDIKKIITVTSVNQVGSTVTITQVNDEYKIDFKK